MKAPVVFAGLAIALTSACSSSECEHLTDCPGSLVCSSDGRCVVNEAPEVHGGYVAGSLGRAAQTDQAAQEDALENFSVGEGFAGVIGDETFTDPAPGVSGSSDGYIAYELTTTTPTGAVLGMWFDIPLPSLTPEGTTQTFTLEEMMNDGTLPCISIWGDGFNTWADDYAITVSPVTPEGFVTLAIEATNATSEVVATLTVPQLIAD